MPTISERQLFIQEILHVVNDLEQISRIALDCDMDEMSSDSSQSPAASESDSSSSSSSSSSSYSSSSGSEGFMSFNGTDTDGERTIIMGMTIDLLHVKSCLLLPNMVLADLKQAKLVNCWVLNGRSLMMKRKRYISLRVFNLNHLSTHRSFAALCRAGCA